MSRGAYYDVLIFFCMFYGDGHHLWLQTIPPAVAVQH
jgi:hypothetical protein